MLASKPGECGWWEPIASLAGYNVDNNQTGGAHVDLCYQYNGGNCFEGPAAGYYEWDDLTPINSIRLRA